MKTADRLASMANDADMKIAVYRHGKQIDVYNTKDLRYVITTYEGQSIPYITDGMRSRRLSNGTTWSNALRYIKAFEALVRYGVATQRTIHGIEITNMRYHLNQYSNLDMLCAIR